MKKFVFEGVLPAVRTSCKGVELSVEDGGSAKIATFYDGNSDELFVRLQSGTEKVDYITDKYVHADFDSMAGKKVRITVEVVED